MNTPTLTWVYTTTLLKKREKEIRNSTGSFSNEMWDAVYLDKNYKISLRITKYLQNKSSKEKF